MSVKIIHESLDLAWNIRQNNGNYVPLYVSEPGLGKSVGVKTWADNKGEDFGFIDIRLAYFLGPDIAGCPYEYKGENGVMRSGVATPDMWPTKGQGVIFIDEINRGNEMTQNAMMQLLTDRIVNGHKIPDGWIICCAANPPTELHNVTAFDSALENRVHRYNLEYSHKEFLEYIKISKWNDKVINFLNSGIWVYMPPSQISNESNAKYVSPRTWEHLSKAENNGLSKLSSYLTHCIAMLGSNTGNEYFTFQEKEKPVTYSMLIEDPKKALKALKDASKEGYYRGDLATVTTQSFIDEMDKKENENEKECDKIMKQLEKIVDYLPGDHVENVVENLINTLKEEETEKLLKKYKKSRTIWANCQIARNNA